MVMPIQLSPARRPAVTYRIRQAEAAFVAEAEESMARHTYVVWSAGIAVGIVFTDFFEDAFQTARSAGRGGFWGRFSFWNDCHYELDYVGQYQLTDHRTYFPHLL